MNVEIGTEAAQFLFWEYIKPNFFAVQAPCIPAERGPRRPESENGNLGANRGAVAAEAAKGVAGGPRSDPTNRLLDYLWKYKEYM